MASKSCSKCGAKVVPHTPRYTANIPNTTIDETLAVVQFRQTIQLNNRNFHVSEVIELNYGLIAALLGINRDVLFFPKNADRIKFYLTYPELKS